MYVKAAYLNVKLEEDIYMEAPKGDKNYKKCFWKLKKALYCLKQAGRMWNNTLNNVLIGIGFKKGLEVNHVYIQGLIKEEKLLVS